MPFFRKRVKCRELCAAATCYTKASQSKSPRSHVFKRPSLRFSPLIARTASSSCDSLLTPMISDVTPEIDAVLRSVYSYLPRVILQFSSYPGNHEIVFQHAPRTGDCTHSERPNRDATCSKIETLFKTFVSSLPSIHGACCSAREPCSCESMVTIDFC